MRSRRSSSAMRFISLGLLLGAIILAATQLVRFSRVRSYLPAGLVVAGVPVGGLDRQGAAERLMEVYSMPVEMDYGGAKIQLNPSVVDFQLDVENMLALANMERTQKQFWQDFWDYLWGRTTFPTQIPLNASYSQQRLRVFLTDVSQRYDQAAQPALPVPGSVDIKAGKSGSALDIDGAVPLIEAALFSLDNRQVELPLRRVEPAKPVFQNLAVLLKETIQVSGFDGLAGVYVEDLQSGQELHFAVMNGKDVPSQPDIAFTASSIIKIPIMVATFRRMKDQSDPETEKLLSDMITKSGNEAADWLMDRVIDPQRAPLVVTQDMQELGLKNTFLAGYFSFGSPLLETFQTPGNTRTDINTDPDPYSQTSPSDIGMLLDDIYRCAQNSGGALIAAFPGEITQQECQAMNTLLINNRLPVLLTAGLPEATQIAHKHGWVSTNGIINTIGDAGIVYSPGGNYVVVIFLNHPDQLIWESASALISRMSQTIYNFYNLPQS